MPKVPKNATVETYNRTHLESLTRVKIQALAKAANIKANGKTAAIIEQLLLKQDAIDVGRDQETAVSSSGSFPRATSVGRTNDVGEGSSSLRQQQEPELVSVKIEEAALPPSASMGRPQTPPCSQAAAQQLGTPSPQSRPRPSAVGFQEGNHPSRSTPYRRCTPYPRRRSGSGSARSSGSPSAREAIEALIPAQEPTDKDVREMRRRLAGWVDEHAAGRSEMRTLRRLLQYTERQCQEARREVEVLAWKREAVEEVVVAFKSDRHLWDGTAMMEDDEARMAWREYVAAEWQPFKERAATWRYGEELRAKEDRRVARRQRRDEREARRAAGEDVDSDSSAESLDDDAADRTLLVDNDNDADDIYM